jgi:hypothetical protein
MVTDVFRPK